MPLNRRQLLASAAAFGVSPALRGAEKPKRPTNASEVWARTELYFGTNRSSGAPVTDDEFNRFLEGEVTSRFPDGLTLLDAYGQFRSSAGDLIRERSFLLILFYPVQTADANQRIQAIRDAYKYAFSQESVLRVDSFSFVSF